VIFHCNIAVKRLFLVYYVGKNCLL